MHSIKNIVSFIVKPTQYSIPQHYFLIETAVENEKKNFLSEIDMMKMISEKHHPNVIGLVGCVTIQEPLCLILEVASFGDFLSYLRTNRKMVRKCMELYS